MNIYALLTALYSLLNSKFPFLMIQLLDVGPGKGGWDYQGLFSRPHTHP
jgi:hypothetical protein